MSQNNELQLLPFYDNRSKQNHLKWWTYGKVFSIISELDKIPPFQIQKEANGQSVSALTLVNFNDGSEVDILANATTAGLNIAIFDDYENIVYPSTLLLGIPNITIGFYYLRITFSTTTLYSEVFGMVDDVSDFIKIEYYHSEDFCFPNGHIDYSHPFRNFLFVPSDIAKPSIEYEEQVVKREGINFPVQQISYVLHRFSMYAPEFLVYALRVIQLHDFVKITYSGFEYDVDEILMASPKWENEGDIAVLDFEFKTDTIIVQNARGVGEADVSAPSGTCVSVDYDCVAMIIKDSTEYNNFEYNPSGGSQAIGFQAADLVIIKDIVADRIEVFSFETGPDRYEQQPLLASEVAFEANTNQYFFAPSTETDNVVEPLIDSVSTTGGNGLVFGEAFANTVVEIWVRFQDQNGITQEEKRGQGLSSLLTSTGVPFTWDISVLQVQLRVSSAVCPLFSVSTWYTLQTITPEGIGEMGIEFDFIITS